MKNSQKLRTATIIACVCIIAAVTNGIFGWLESIEREKTKRTLIEKQSEVWLAKIKAHESNLRHLLEGKHAERALFLNTLLPIISRLADTPGTERLQMFLDAVLRVLCTDSSEISSSFKLAWIEGGDIDL